MQHFLMVHFVHTFPLLLLWNKNPVPTYVTLALPERPHVAKTLHLVTTLNKEVPWLCLRDLNLTLRLPIQI